MKEVPEVPRKESTLQLSNYQFQGACCDHLTVRCKTDTFPHKSCLGHFDVLVDIEGEPMVILGASCFHHKQEKLYLYRSKYGHWCIGCHLGRNTSGVVLRSCLSDEEKWSHCCPCTVQQWKVLKEEHWESETGISVTIRRKRMLINMDQL